MQTILINLSQDQLNMYTLVLSASNIIYRIQRDGDGWNILVDKNDAEQAMALIKMHIAETRIQPFVKHQLHYGKTYSGVLVALILLICHIIVLENGQLKIIFKNYGASAEYILNGDIFRTVTALMLHKNSIHLFSNMAGIAFFGSIVCSIFGNGVGWLLILMTGIAGNLLNAFFYQRYHLSIGASTAVFGAIGLLAGYRFWFELRVRKRRFVAWLPLGAGAALLAFLGASTETDVLAHFFGFLSGCMMGAGMGQLGADCIKMKYQIYSMIVCLWILVSAWIIALTPA